MAEQQMADLKANILVVDDNLENLRFLTKVLTAQGYRVRPVSDALLALTSAHAELPDLILLDIMMPGMDGFKVCENLKANEHTRDVPIIFISALDDMESKINAFERGGVDYVTKPFRVGEVLARIKTHITLHNMQTKLEAANAELQRSNEELLQFANVISHDLQEPLRMVTSYLALLEQRYTNKLDQDAQEFIWYAVDGATRMQLMIRDLLDYARIDTRGKKFEITNCNVLLQQVLNGLSVSIEEKDAVITNDPLPEVRADGIQLSRVFQNLLDNALKFHGAEPPHVHISARRAAAEWLFSVRDTGIGIEGQYAECIFGMFQRLHTREEYEGTGIGLTICKKIIERHDGRIWVESAPGAGATFYFTLPAIPPAAP